ncbi:MAG: redoxin domain-containing protein [Candidatus Diapherotrites archaeon]|nr:redoxin domain-containing protein [Candidatus Diapherotrites archaeon]
MVSAALFASEPDSGNVFAEETEMQGCCGEGHKSGSHKSGSAGQQAEFKTSAGGKKLGFGKTALTVVLALAVVAGLLFFLRPGSTGQVSATATGNTVGAVAPGFELKDIAGNSVKLSDFKGRAVILFFNEGGMCYPSCWNQIKALATDERLNNENVASFSVVVDNTSDWEKITAHVPGFSQSGLLFDTSKVVSSSYGALNMPSSMHGGMMPGHTYYIIGKDGKIKFIFDDPQMGVRNDLLAAEIAKLV